MKEHYLQTVRWPVLPILNYKGVEVVKTISGFTVLRQNVETPEDVDKVIQEAHNSIKNSLK